MTICSSVLPHTPVPFFKPTPDNTPLPRLLSDKAAVFTAAQEDLALLVLVNWPAVDPLVRLGEGAQVARVQGGHLAPALDRDGVGRMQGARGDHQRGVGLEELMIFYTEELPAIEGRSVLLSGGGW